MTNLDLRATVKTDKWWKPKATNLLGILYLVMFLMALPFQNALLLFFPSVLTILGIGSFGHILNDWYDVEADKKAGKTNRLANLSLWKRRALLGGALLIALLPWLLLPFDNTSLFLLIAEFALLITYAVPPLRLKEKSIWPILVDGGYAYAIPAVLAAHTFFLASGFGSDLRFIIPLFIWQWALGIRHFLNHLAMDRANDLVTKTPTLATEKGNRFIHGLIKKVVLPIELLGLATFFILIGQEQLTLSLTILALFILFSFLPLILGIGRNYALFSYRFSKTFLDGFYQDILPFILLAFLMVKDWRYFPLLLVHFLLFYKIDERFLISRSKLPSSVFIRILFYWPTIVLASPFFFLRKKINKPVESFELMPDTGNSGKVAPLENKHKYNIALININKSKYTETFIQGLVPRLDYNIYYLHGGALPLFDHKDRHFLSNWGTIQSMALLLESLFKLERNFFLKQSISSYLQTNNIRLVLAEFGPVGARMISITYDLGIPLIVFFHGYDVFHKPTLEDNLPYYKHLFKNAKKIVVVSELMVKRLIMLGAPEKKLVHLPAYVNLSLFPYKTHGTLPPRFLAVGRFCETKSPHLILLAFHQVLKRIPNATLTMIGKDGGGELFEACLILTKALQIEDKVQFKGVMKHEDVAKEMSKARIFIQHSLTTPENGDMEGKPVAIMEAMLSGLPVIATRHSGIVELIDDGLNGFLVAEYDIDSMADLMVRLATSNELVDQMGKAAHEKIRGNPLIANHISILEGIIKDCIEEN